MFKKIKTFILAVLMAALFPVLRLPNHDEAAPAPIPAPGADPPPAPDTQARIAELEKSLAGRESELTQAKDKISGLEKAAANTTARVILLESRLQKAVAGYKQLITASNPDIPPEMLAGETLEDLGSSLAKARSLVDKVKANLQDQAHQQRIPAGAPQRGSAAAANLSPRDKIREGVGRGRGGG